MLGPLFPASLVFFVLICGSLAVVLPQRNKTITVPEDVTYHQESGNICTPASWTDFVSFFFGNYISHAATVVTFPGEPTRIKTINMVLAVFFPCIGAGRGLMAILRRTVFLKNPLQRALHSQALCMVVRSRDWTPMPGDSVRSISFMPGVSPVKEIYMNLYHQLDANRKSYDKYIKKLENYRGLFRVSIESPPWMIWPSSKTHWFLNLIPPGYKVCANYDLPTGYALAYVPPNAIVQPTSSGDGNESPHWKSNIVSSTSLASPLIAIAQIFYASATLYQSRGDQIARYGYAAFGFTVLPYLIMSFVNLLGRVLTPTYSDLYLVQTEIMDEAIQRGGHFENIVGSLLSDPLPVKDLFVFSGVFKNQHHGLWEFQLSSKVYSSGEIEPSTKERLRSAPTNDTMNQVAKGDTHPPSKLSSEDTATSSAESKKEDDEEDENVLICPRCYNFQVSENKELPRVLKGKKIRSGYILFSISLLIIVTTPLLVIGVMSRFEPGGSTIAQRVWILGWLLVGMAAINNPFCVDLIFIGIDNVKSRLIHRRYLKARESGPSHRERRHYRQGIKIYLSLVMWICVYLGLLATPAIGRFVVVGQMLREYGSCISLE